MTKKQKTKEIIESYFSESAIKELAIDQSLYVVEETHKDTYIYGLCNYFIELEQTFKGNYLEQDEYQEELIRYDVNGFVEIEDEVVKFEIDYFRGEYELKIGD